MGNDLRMVKKKDICSLAVERYGLTKNHREAGYILSDGRMLNFRGECDPEIRCIDHNDVGCFFRGGDDWVNVKKFQRLCKAVRFSKVGVKDAYVFVDVVEKPSARQVLEIKRAVRRARSVVIDQTSDEDSFVCGVEADFPLGSDVDKFVKKCFKNG